VTIDTPARVLPTVRITPPRGWSWPDLREVWEYRELALFLLWRDFKVRYQQTVLGVVWAVVQPLATLLVFTIVFGRLAQLPSDGVPYPIFALAGMLPWQLFAAALAGSANSLIGSAGLVTKVYFPRLIIPIAATLLPIVDFAITGVLLALLMAWYGVVPGPGLFVLPLFVIVALTTAFAVGLWLSALNVRYRDIQHGLPFLIQVWFFASPVAYSLSLVPSDSPWRVVYALNPMVGVIQGFRWALFGSVPPWTALLPSLAALAVLFAGGLVYFRRIEDRFADVI
jgi:lipopolysaccharide transport system permease protein